MGYPAVLAALSAGYAHGGKRADAAPTRKEFYKIIEKAGAALVATFFLMMFVLPDLGAALPLSWGPLVAAIMLFSAPSYFLGMLSPFAIKLGHIEKPSIGIGTISGKVFFWSTCGSIIGALLAGFILIPYLGISTIMAGTTMFVLLLGTLGSLSIEPKDRARIVLVAAASLILMAIVFYDAQLPPGVVYRQDGVYEKITIVDETYAGRPARFFYQDKSSSGARFLDGDDMVFSYTLYYQLYKFWAPDTSRALFIGGGIYAMPSALERDLPKAHIDVAEIEPSLFSLAKEYFSLPADTRIQNHTEDGRRLLQEQTTPYDLIFSDVYYSLFSIPAHFTTREFFSLAKEKLSQDGIFIANLIGSLSPQQPSLILSELRTMRDVFPYVYAFGVESASTTEPQNIIVVGSKVPKSLSEIPPTLRSHSVDLDLYDLSKYPLFTDDYAPVDTMVASLIGASVYEPIPTESAQTWKPSRALADIEKQVSFGPRALGTSGHAQGAAFIQAELGKTPAQVQVQRGTYTDAKGVQKPLRNIIARFDPDNPRRIILGTHYDSILVAYRDPDTPSAPMPGANNGASGVAVLLETARTLSASVELPVGVDLIFFDGEEGPLSLGAGDPNWRALGSPYFADHLQETYPGKLPELAIVFDMVCDADLALKKEPSSLSWAPSQVDEFWKAGQSLAPRTFLESSSPVIYDDHTALGKAGIPSFLVIDYDYRWYNTADDTPDKCSAASLEGVGGTLIKYLYSLR